MSNPLYNPYASENQRRLSGIQAERESHRVSSHLGHGSSLNSSGSPSTSPDNSEQRLPSLVPNYRSERSSASVNEDIQRSIYMHLSRAREESRQLGKQIHQPVDQGTHRIELLSSSGTGMMSHPHTAGHSENQSSHGSVSQLLNYSQPIADDNSTFYTSSSSSSYLDSGNSRFNVSKKGQHDIQSIPGLGDYDYPGPDKSHAVTEPSRPKYTSESAANILMQFGLEKEDLEHLIAYPEDQITPENLPFILRQIRMQKVKRATNAEKSKRNIPDPPPPRSTGGMDSWTSSRGAGMPQEEVPSSRHQQSKVIDYGHTGKYTGEMRDEMGSRRSEGGGSESLLLGNFDSSSHHKELLPKGGRSSALGSSRDHATLSSSYSSRLTSEVPSSNDQTILKSLSLLMKDTDVRVNTSDASKPLSLKELKADHQPTSKSQTSSALFHGGNPSRPGLVVIDSKYNTKGRTTNDGQGSTVAEQKKQSQQQQNSQKQLSQKQQELKQRAKQPEQKPQQQQQPKQEQKQTQKAPMQQQEPTQQKQFTMPAQMGRAVWPAAFSAGQPYLPVTPTFHIPSLFDVMRNPLLLPRTMPVPPAQPPSNSQPPMKGPVYKGSPSPDMMHDYAAASPRVFPHTCSLCNKECTQMKDWISHQNSTLHLENCKFLGRQYPDWDGEVALSDTRSKPSSSTSQHHQHKTRHGSSSSPCSPDPRWHRCSEGGRDKRRSRSRSPHSSRYSRRSRSYSSTSSSDCYRSRSKSYERRRDRHSSPSRSYERRSSPNKSRERRSYDRRSSPRRSWERRSSPQRGRERRSRDKRSSPQKREERSSSRGKKSTSAERLAKKLLESSAVQSLSKQSNVEAVVKTLAPALLAELSKMKSSSLSSTPSSSREEGSSSAASSSSSAMKSSAKSKSGKASPPTMLTLEGVPHCLTHDEVVTAVEQFGKTKSVVLFRAQLEAIVCFEKEEDAKSLRNTKSFTLKGFPISVARERESHKEQKKPEKKTATLSTAKPQTAARKTAGGNLPGNEKTTEKASVKDPARDAKPPKQTVKTVKVEGDVTKPQVKKSGVAKDKGLPKKLETNIKESGLKKSAKGPKMVHETKMSACKGETQKPESPTGPPTVVKDKEMSEKTAKENSTSTTGGKRRDVEMSKLEDCKSKVKESGPKQLKSEAETNDMKDPDPPELGQPRAAGSEPKKVESCTEGKEQNLSAVETVPDKPKESEAAAKLRDGAEAAAVKDPSGNLPGLTAAAETEREPAAATSMEAVTPLTIGEMMEQHLHQKRIVCLKMKTCFSEKFCSLGKKQLLITNLPEYSHGCYTEQDIVDLLTPFGFQYSEESIYVIPQIRMAFAFMPTVEDVLSLMKARQGLNLKGSRSKLRLHVLGGNVATTPLGFYKSVMKLMSSPVADHGSRTIFVKNILPSEARNLRETLRKIVSVRNFLPLLSKVFIELESDGDADLIGVWYALLKQPPTYEIHRLKVPQSACPPLSPPTELLQLLGQRLRVSKFGVPKGSAAPFWLTMTTTPFLFPTVSPWFVIPEYLTVTGEDTIQEASSRGAKSPTIMLTGLPETQYKHEDIAELVWSYFSKRSLQSLYYNVIVLPLQRRAFVYFEDWTSCCNFVRDHFKSPVSVGGTLLHVHFVLQSMSPESREEDMYISLMKLSNAHVSAPESLEERLLCVEISGIMKDTIPKVVGLVACVAPFVNFLPLANRICIEMAQPSSVMKVVEKCNGLLQDYAKKFETWTKVQRFETMKSLKQHLQDSSKSTINLERNRANAKANLPPVPQPLVDLRSPASPESSDPAGSNISEVVTAGPSMTDARNEAGEGDCQTLEADNAMDSISPKANVNVEKSKGHVEEGVSKSLSTEGETCTSISCGSDVTAGLAKGGVLHKEKKEGWSSLFPKQDQADFTHDSDFPIVHQLHQENFNMDDFVTVDEVGDDMENVSVDLPVSAKTMASSKDSKRRSFSVTSSKPSAPSLKDSKTSTLSSSNTSTKDKTTTRLSKSGEDISEELYEVVDSIEDELLPDAKYTESSGRWSLGGKTEKKQTSDVRKPVSDEEATFKILDSVDDDTAVATRSARGTKGRSTNAKTTQVEKPRRSRRTPASQDVAKEKPPKKEEEEPLKESTPSRMNDPLMKEEATYQILHSLEGKVKDDPPTAVGKVIRGRPKKEVVTEKHSTPFQKGNKGLSKIVVNEEVATYQILDSVEEEVKNDPPSAGRKGRSGRPKKEVMNNKGSMSLGKDPNELSETALNDEEATFQILDSVDDKVQDDSSAAWRKESQGSKEEMETTKREIALLLKNDKDLANMVMDEEEATYQILDSVEEEFKDDPPTEAKRGRRGRTKRGVRTKKGSMSLQKDHNELFEIAADEDDATYQILDSVEEEVQDDSSTAGRKDSQGPEAKIETTKKEIKLLQKDDDNLAKTEVDEEEATYQILDSVEEEVREDSQTEAKKRRRGRPKKEVPTKKVTTSLQKDHSEVSKIAGDEGEAAYQILDSVEDEVQDDAQTALRSGRGERPKREVTAKKGNTSLENENNESSEIAVDEEQATYQILDSVEDEVQDDAPTSRGEERPAGPKREFTTTEEDTKSASETADEEELTFQILDSVEEEMVDQQPLMEQPKSPKNHNCKFPQQENKEEEPVYQVVDSLSDQVGDELSDRARKGRMAEEETQKPQSNTAILGGQNKQTKRNTTAVTRSLGYLDEVSEEEEDYPDDTAEEEEVRERQASAKKKQLVKVRGDRKTTEREDRRSRERDEERRSRSCSRSERKRGEQEGERVTLYEVRADEPGEGINSTEVTSAQATLDEVSEEEEDFSDDTVEEEEVRKRQAAVKEKRFAKEEEERKNQEREERRSGEQEEREHRSSGEGTRRTTEEEQKEDVRAPESRGRARDITEEELQALVTLDEIVEEEEEEEEGKPCLLSQEDELAGSINPEVKSADVSFDFNTVEGVKERRTKEEEEEKDRKQEEVDDKDKVMAGEKSAAGNSMVPLDKEGHETAPPSQEDKSVDPFYLQTVTTLDEAGDDGEKKEDKGQPKEEEEEEQEEKEAPTPNTRGRGRKRSRRTPVRKSTRGKKGSEKEETQAAGSDVPPPTSVVAPSSLDLEIKKTASAGQELTPEQLDNQNPGGGKRKSEPVGPEAKRSRSQSPCVAATFELPAFRPDNPLGQEFLRSAYFCNVCAAFYLNETTTKEAHCCSQTHYDKLKKYYQELKEKSSRTSR